MGKGSIISHDGDGLYTVTVKYDTSGVSSAISVLEGIITELDAIISDPESTEKDVLFAKIRKLSAQKRIDYLGSRVPYDKTVSAWCADLTEDLSGEVGTIEIARNKDKGLLIQPGFEGNAAYDQARDGQLVPTMAMPPVNNFVNLGFLPGMQKWAPGYRTGTVTAIDYEADTCDVTLDSVTSSQQGLDVNKLSALTDVPIDYMSCNAAAFETGDNVVVKFKNYDWEQPTVIGFKNNPQPCGACFILINIGSDVSESVEVEKYYLWDLKKNEEMPVLDGDGNEIPDPSSAETLDYANRLGGSSVGSSTFYAEFKQRDYWLERDDNEAEDGSYAFCPSLKIEYTPRTESSNIYDMDGSDYYQNTFTAPNGVNWSGYAKGFWTSDIHNMYGRGVNIVSYSGDISCFVLHNTEDRGYEYSEYIEGEYYDIAVEGNTWVNKTYEIHSPYGALPVGDAGVEYYSCRILCYRSGAFDYWKGELQEKHELYQRDPEVVSQSGQNSFLSFFFMPILEYERTTDYTVDPPDVTVHAYRYTYRVMAGAEYYKEPSTPPVDMAFSEIMAKGRNTALENFLETKLSQVDDGIHVRLICDLYE